MVDDPAVVPPVMIGACGVFVGVGVRVDVGVAVSVVVGVVVGVAVLVGVAVGYTHVPRQANPAAPPWPPPSQTRPEQPLKLFGSQTRPGSQVGGMPGQQGAFKMPHISAALACPAARRSTTSTANPTRFMAVRVPETALRQKES
jgi:hypothetical protein